MQTYTQLPMFVDPSEIVEGQRDGTWDSLEGGLTGYKLDEALKEGTYQAIKSTGKLTPIVGMLGLDQPMLGNGHHRVATTYDLGYKLIPIVWTENWTWADSNYEPGRY